MEFEDVVRARRMVRSYTDEPVDAALIDALIDLARRAPSAGKSQGTHWIVLEGPAQTARYWDTTLPTERRASFPWPGLLHAPVIVVPVADEAAYLDRYSEADKRRSGLGAETSAWAVPYWQIDTAMATMTLLHAAVDRGLGALFFGIFDHTEAVCAEFGLPASARPIGAVTIGWPSDSDRKSKSAQRPRLPLDSVLHRGGWQDGQMNASQETGQPE